MKDIEAQSNTTAINRRNLETIRQAVAELYHCVEAGPQWFTNNRSGQIGHARMWVDYATGAIAEIDEVLSQAQDCIRGETPEDCTVEEAREDTVQRIRGALNL